MTGFFLGLAIGAVLSPAVIVLVQIARRRK
jgi:hypothetical protein